MHRGGSVHARLSGPAVGAAGQPRLLARLRLTLRVMRLRLWWLRLLALLPLLAAHVRHSPGRRRHGLRQRLVFQARVVLVVSRRLLRVRQRSAWRRAASPPAAGGLRPGARDPGDVAACTGGAGIARHRDDGGPATDGGGGGAARGSSRCHSGPPPVNFFRAVRLHGRRSSSAREPASSSPIDSDLTR